MTSYKTIIAVIGGFALAIYYFLIGDTQQAFNYLMFALALLGIGDKFDKLKR